MTQIFQGKRPLTTPQPRPINAGIQPQAHTVTATVQYASKALNELLVQAQAQGWRYTPLNTH